VAVVAAGIPVSAEEEALQTVELASSSRLAIGEQGGCVGGGCRMRQKERENEREKEKWCDRNRISVRPISQKDRPCSSSEVGMPPPTVGWGEGGAALPCEHDGTIDVIVNWGPPPVLLQ
jgi:hypothetical protein